ncbi:NAD-dependent epimerase/dehydratase family protein [Roseomonas sp. OT10]|uniref:NAD-dependent epimerase/dehydratase family protein n=1 Tax=Roseomonas cutis TaxID=2897332 RepID=UPI001E4737BF|nr:NAD-dependent epimerase/dehydratase family protein [Roseomonas sp. OT10]UFN49306.1 NAD-dependent epimerase/dehydratase family protein [Roseomonas sp. OT10]
MTAPLAAVTGGTGFLGRAVLPALAAEGWRLRLLVRREPGFTPPPGTELVRGALDDPAALARLLHGAGVAVHLAGEIRALPRRDLFAANAAGSAAVATALEPGTRLVLVSSQAARAPEVSDYAASKRAGEAAVERLPLDSPWVVLRPCAVHGPGDEAACRFLRLAALPLAPVPRGREPRLALIQREDAAAGIAAFCRAGAPSGRVFELTDARIDGYGWREILALAARALGRPPPRLVPLPDAAFRAAGAWSERLAHWRGRAAFFGRGKAAELLHRDWTPDPAAQPPAALWQPQITAAEGFAALARARPAGR